MSTQAIWRNPAEESADLYPGLVVHDGRVTGSITLGVSRLPAWAIVADMCERGWPAVESNWQETHGIGEREFAAFLHSLLEMRGEFGRLLLMLADAERREQSRSSDGPAWWDVKRNRREIGAQLRRCLAALEVQQ